MEKILENGSLLLAQVSKMNDGRESKTVGGNLFATCFSHGLPESVAMWNTYGIPRHDAVRLCFDGRIVRKFLDGKFGPFRCRALDKNRAFIENIPPDKIELTMADIAYASLNERYSRYRDIRYIVLGEDGNDKNLLDGHFAGYVKMEGWNYERETRLLLKLKNCVVPGLAYISIDFSAAVDFRKSSFNVCPVVLGPWAKPGKLEELKLRGLKVGKSAFTGYLDNLKTICSKCEDVCRKKCKCKHKDAL